MIWRTVEEENGPLLNVRGVIMEQDYLTCSICQLRIKSGHRFLPFIPGGYGELKGKPLTSKTGGIMHVSHLSSSDAMNYTLSQFIEEA